MRFFFLLTFTAATPATIFGDIAERPRFKPQLAATFVPVGFVHPFFEGTARNERFGIQHQLQSVTGAEFHNSAGSVVVHIVGGWIALPAILLLDARHGRYKDDGRTIAHPPSNILFLTTDAWVLAVDWLGFSVISTQTLGKMSSLIVANSLMAMVGGTFTTWWMGKNDPGFSYNGSPAGLAAVCADSDVIYPLGAFAVGGIAGVLFVWMSACVQNVWRIDDVLGVWPLHGLCGARGGIAAGISGLKAFGGLGGVSFWAQVAGMAGGIAIVLVGDTVVYGTLCRLIRLRLDHEVKSMGADLVIHRVLSTSELETHW